MNDGNKKRKSQAFDFKYLGFSQGVQDETRTHTAYRPLPPQSSASTNSATWTFLLNQASIKAWSEKRDSNPRPRPWQGRALPTELFSHSMRTAFRSLLRCKITTFFSSVQIYFHLFLFFISIIHLNAYISTIIKIYFFILLYSLTFCN